MNGVDLEGLVQPVIEASGLELVEVAFLGGRGRGVLRITVDREGGVDLDAVAEVSERIGRRLDLEGFAPGRYTLEVSSPGVERPLRRPEDFRRKVGSKVEVKTDVDGERITLTGTLVEAGPETVTIATERGTRTVRFDDVAAARSLFEWPKTEKGGRR